MIQALPERQKLTPVGVPLSHALNVSRSKAQKAAATIAKDALRVLDTIIADGALPRVPLDFPNLAPENQGIHERKRNGQTKRLRINRVSPVPRLTLYHEIGHMLDRQALGPGEAFGSDNLNPFAPAFADLLRWCVAVYKSRAFRNLVAQAVRDSHARYLLHSRELFARSFAQWVIVSSGDVTSLGELNLVRDPANFTGQPYPYQWSDDDFQPIKAALDTLFLRRGWLK